MLIVLKVYAHASEDMASDLKPQRLNRDDIMELIVDTDFDGDISDCDRRVS